MTPLWPEWYPPLVDLQGLPEDVAWAEADRIEDGDARPWIILLLLALMIFGPVLMLAASALRPHSRSKNKTPSGRRR